MPDLSLLMAEFVVLGSLLLCCLAPGLLASYLQKDS